MERRFRGGIAAFSCVLVLVLLSVLVGGCGRGPVATVGAEKITEKDFVAELERAAGQTVLYGMIQDKTIEAEAAAQGITFTDEQLKKETEIAQLGFQIELGLPNQQAFQQWLASQGGPERFLRQVRFDALVTALRTKDVKISEAEVQQAFEANKEQLGSPALYSIREIAVPSRTKAQQHWAALQKSEEGFLAIAQADSESTYPGGQLPMLPLDRIGPPVIRDAVAKMKVGDIAGPFQAGDLWRIVKLEDKTPPIKATLKDPIVRGLIERLVRTRKGKTVDQLFDELRAKYRVNVLWPQYESLEEQFRSPTELPDFGTGGTPTTPKPAPSAGPNAPAAGPGAKPAPPAQGEAAKPGAAPKAQQPTTPAPPTPPKPAGDRPAAGGSADSQGE